MDEKDDEVYENNGGFSKNGRRITRQKDGGQAAE